MDLMIYQNVASPNLRMTSADRGIYFHKTHLRMEAEYEQS